MTTPAQTHIAIEPIPANPGYIANITGHLADPETDPTGSGMTRAAAALDLARDLLSDGSHICSCLAIAAYLREDMEQMLAATSAPPAHANIMRIAYERAIRTVEAIA